MEYFNVLDKIDNDEEIGETWIEALIRSFNFPDSPHLFHILTQLNNRVKEMTELYDSYSKGDKSIQSFSVCDCSLPPIFNFWYFTKHLPIDKTRLVIILRSRTENSRHSPNKISLLPTPLESHWAKQGIFLVRSYISPECQQNDHNGWRVLTDTLLEYMANNNPDALFVIVCPKKEKDDDQCYRNAHNPLKYLQKDSQRFLVIEDDDQIIDGDGNDKIFQATLEKKQRLLFNLCQAKLKDLGKEKIQWEI